MALHVVAVFQHERGPGRKPLVTAYTRDFNPAWEGCCLHRVDAENGTRAKALAIAEHKTGLGCRGSVFPSMTHAPRKAE